MKIRPLSDRVIVKRLEEERKNMMAQMTMLGIEDEFYRRFDSACANDPGLKAMLWTCGMLGQAEELAQQNEELQQQSEELTQQHEELQQLRAAADKLMN